MGVRLLIQPIMLTLMEVMVMRLHAPVVVVLLLLAIVSIQGVVEVDQHFKIQEVVMT